MFRMGVGRLKINIYKRGPALYAHEQIVEIMSNSTGKRANGFKFLGLLELLL